MLKLASKWIRRHPIITIIILFLSAKYINDYGLVKYDLIILSWGIIFFFSIGSIIFNHKESSSNYDRRPVNYSSNDEIEFEEYTPLTPEEISELKNLVYGTTPYNNTYKNAYESKFLLTQNEKYQFKIIQKWATEKNLLVFTKVRLLDLIEPRKDISNYKTALWKIQAKHIDFLICDQQAKVKCLIEIDDSSHNRPDRIERDKFVNEILQACGYKILRTYNITEKQLDEICGYNI